MASIQQLCMNLHRKHLATLNIYRLVQQDEFKRAYEVATESERLISIGFVDTNDQIALTAWTRNILRKYKEYEYLDVRCLRDIASDNGIKGYSLMNRIELINILTRKESSNDSNKAS